MRLLDRKAVLSAIVLTAAYVCILLTALLLLGHRAGLHQPKAVDGGVLALMSANAVLLLWRLCIRACFVARSHGRREAFWSFPRSIIANIVAIMAARRAVAAYVRHLSGGTLLWDKTAHSHFPQSAARSG